MDKKIPIEEIRYLPEEQKLLEISQSTEKNPQTESSKEEKKCPAKRENLF